MTAAQAAGQARAPVLVARRGREQHVFLVGAEIRVGRNPSLELIFRTPRVSRDTRGLITSDENDAVSIDRSSESRPRRKRPRGPLRITESAIPRLGDPVTGEELGITPPPGSGADFCRVAAGLNLALLVALPNGGAVTVSTGGLPQLTPMGTTAAVSVGDRGDHGPCAAR